MKIEDKIKIVEYRIFWCKIFEDEMLKKAQQFINIGNHEMASHIKNIEIVNIWHYRYQLTIYLDALGRGENIEIGDEDELQEELEEIENRTRDKLLGLSSGDLGANLGSSLISDLEALERGEDLVFTEEDDLQDILEEIEKEQI